MFEIKTVSVIGMGYIGLPTCAIFASRGLEVIGIDVNATVVEKVNRGEIHIVEPDLDGLIQKVVANGKTERLHHTAAGGRLHHRRADAHHRGPQARYQLRAHGRHAACAGAQEGRPGRAGIDLAGRHHPRDDRLLAELRPDLKFPHRAWRKGRHLRRLFARARAAGQGADRTDQQ